MEAYQGLFVWGVCNLPRNIGDGPINVAPYGKNKTKWWTLPQLGEPVWVDWAQIFPLFAVLGRWELEEILGSEVFVLSLVPNNVQNGVPNVFSTCSPCFATYSMYCSYKPHFIPYSLPKDITFLLACTSKLGNLVSFVSLERVSKVLKFVFSECHKFWKIFSWGINQWRLFQKTKKKKKVLKFGCTQDLGFRQ